VQAGDLVRWKDADGLGIIIETTKRPTKSGFDIRVRWASLPRNTARACTWESRLWLEVVNEGR